jgi:hypothetical protein
VGAVVAEFKYKAFDWDTSREYQQFSRISSEARRYEFFI